MHWWTPYPLSSTRFLGLRFSLPIIPRETPRTAPGHTIAVGLAGVAVAGPAGAAGGAEGGGVGQRGAAGAEGLAEPPFDRAGDPQVVLAVLRGAPLQVGRLVGGQQHDQLGEKEYRSRPQRPVVHEQAVDLREHTQAQGQNDGNVCAPPATELGRKDAHAQEEVEAAACPVVQECPGHPRLLLGISGSDDAYADVEHEDGEEQHGAVGDQQLQTVALPGIRG
mmetsp:Transcript_167473/g.407107  ORF Transcript_167473/g.407107 Transcript_167473/m.407107 type:complete len:222 (+) Transcript_167473:172-837(+)